MNNARHYKCSCKNRTAGQTPLRLPGFVLYIEGGWGVSWERIWEKMRKKEIGFGYG